MSVEATSLESDMLKSYARPGPEPRPKKDRGRRRKTEREQEELKKADGALAGVTLAAPALLPRAD